jgi:hypothetical protein
MKIDVEAYLKMDLHKYVDELLKTIGKSLDLSGLVLDEITTAYYCLMISLS